MTEMYARQSSPFTHIVVYTLGGAVSRVAANETAVAYRDARHAVIAIGMWQDASEDEAQIAWVREFAQLLQPFSSGGFYPNPNYEEDAAEDRIIAAYGPEKYERLARTKRKYDPTNVFRLNQNIRPAAV